MARAGENHNTDIHLEGTVSHVVFHNDENGYTVLAMEIPLEGETTVVGILPDVAVGERLEMDGHWETHPKHGSQFKAELAVRHLPTGKRDIQNYLGSGVIRGIKEKLAKQLVDSFGEQTLDVIDREPERLAELKGISLNKAMAISKSYHKVMGMRLLASFVNENQLPMSIVVPLYQEFGDEAVEAIQDNPYLLASRLFGVPFHTVDEMAVKNGVDANAPVRVEAAILHELDHNGDNGHVFVPYEDLVKASGQLIHVEKDVVVENLENLIREGKIVREYIAERDACYEVELYNDESYVAMRIAEMCANEQQPPKNLAQQLERIQKKQGITYAEMQRQAVELAATRQIMLLTGGPGTGKTTSLRGILAIFESMGLKTSLAAPTGRAAKRMAETCGKEASTIHRLLQMAPNIATGNLEFTKNQDDPLEADAVIVDETSMVDISLMASLLRALRSDCKLVLVGDPDQLPSVGPGRVLDHLIRSEVVPSVHLTEIFRQAQQSDIVMNAHGVNEGRMPVSHYVDRKTDFFIMRRNDAQAAIQTVVDLCRERLPKKMGIPADQIQVITPARNKGACTKELNIALQAALNPPARGKGEVKWGDVVFRTGDRVMQIRNNYDLYWEDPVSGATDTGVFNGDIGVITEANPAGITVSFDGRVVNYTQDMLGELEPAYAVTVHKAQGSEFRAVIFVVCEVPYTLLVRGVLYTGITRARDNLILVGDLEQINTMVNNNRPTRRYSALRIRIRRELGVLDS